MAKENQTKISSEKFSIVTALLFGGLFVAVPAIADTITSFFYDGLHSEEFKRLSLSSLLQIIVGFTAIKSAERLFNKS